MANQLTGEFDVVAEVGEDAVNRILAAQHQESGPDEIFMHSLRLPVRETVVEGVWGIAEVQLSPPRISLSAASGAPVVGPVLAAALPTESVASGVGTPVPSALALDLGLTEELAPTRGLAPDFSFRAGGARVTVQFDIRVRFRPDSGSGSAPEFVHGRLDVILSVSQVISPSATVVAVNLDDDVALSFTPAPGAPLSAAERNMVTQAARHVISNELGAVNLVVDLPPTGGDFQLRHWRFKALPHPSQPAVALLLNVRPGHVPTAADRDAFANNFLGANDSLAIAIGRDFLAPTLQDLLEEEIQQAIAGESYTVDLQWPLSDPTYQIALQGQPEVALTQGAIEITIRLEATTNNWTPDADLTLTQSVSLSASAGAINLGLVGNLALSIDFQGGIGATIANLIKFLFEDELKSAAQSALVQAIGQAQPVLDQALAAASGLTEKLRIPPPQLSYNSVAISPEGIVVRGALTIGAWNPVVVSFTSRRLVVEPPPNMVSVLEYTALDSWIPGGTIRRFRWQMGANVEVLHEHQFTMQPAGLMDPRLMWTGWCLEVRGVQNGVAVSRSNCGLFGRAVVAWPGNGNGAGEEDPTLPLPVHDADGNLVAHVDVSRDGRRPGNASPANVVVHFAGADAEATAALVREALPELERKGKSLVVFSVLKPGTSLMQGEDRELAEAGVHLLHAEDVEGGWARAFNVREGQPAFLVIPPKGIVWRSSAQAEAAELVEALNQYMEAVELPPLRMVRAAVRQYELAPNFLFDYIPGARMKLNTLRGRPVYVAFIKSWSQPSLGELRRLQTLSERSGGEQGVVLVVADGEDGREAEALFAEHGFPFRMVADLERKIAHSYGIVAWPTTITIDAGGRVREIRTGMTPVLQDGGEHYGD